MFGDAFKTRLAMLYTNFSRKGKKAKKRTQADIDAIMNADLADLAKIDCTVTKEDCFFVNSFPECPIDEKHLAFAVSSVASWGISKTPMATAEFNGLDEMEKKHTQLVEDFAPYWHFPYKIERVYDQHDRQEYLELVNEQIPWGYQSIGQVLTFGLLGWNRVITRLRLLGVKPESEDRIRFNKVYVLKYILDHLVSHGDRLYMTSLEIGGDLEREIGSLKVRTIQAKCVLERVRKTRAASYQ